MSDTQSETPAPAAESAEALMSEAADRIRALEAERDEFRDKWMRSEAEMQNLRNRTKREVEEARLFAVQKFARDVVEAAENIRRGIDALPPAQDNEPELVSKLREGFESVERNFVSLMERNGIAAEDPVGKMFDANLHQAMAEQASDAHPPGTILQAWTTAWTLNGRLLRPAMVVIAKAPAGGGAPVDTVA